jgi:undecaprenyl diphosphate synthase
VKSAYADFYVVDDYWPDYQPAHFADALDWYSKQDRTLGGYEKAFFWTQRAVKLF